MMFSITENVGAMFNKDDKLNGNNYEIWSKKIQDILKEQAIFKALNVTMEEFERNNVTEHKKDHETYDTWQQMNSMARMILLSSMSNDIMTDFKKYDTTMEMWFALKEKFGATSCIKLRYLYFKFKNYKMRPHHNMKIHLKHMSDMITEIKDVGGILSDWEQVKTVLYSLPQSWDYLRNHLMHDMNIETLNDVAHHLEKEEEYREFAKARACTAGVNSCKGKRKYQRVPNFEEAKEKTLPNKKPKNNQKCYICKQHNHRDCKKGSKSTKCKMEKP